MVAIHIDLGTAKTAHDQEMVAIAIDLGGTVGIVHGRDHQDERETEMTEIVGNEVPQGTWIVMKARSAEE